MYCLKNNAITVKIQLNKWNISESSKPSACSSQNCLPVPHSYSIITNISAYSKLLLLLCSQMPLATQPCLDGGNVSPPSNRHYDGFTVMCHLRTGRLLRNASMKCEESHFSMLEITLYFPWGWNKKWSCAESNWGIWFPCIPRELGESIIVWEAIAEREWIMQTCLGHRAGAGPPGSSLWQARFVRGHESSQLCYLITKFSPLYFLSYSHRKKGRHR